jgi:hypothetical protein
MTSDATAPSDDRAWGAFLRWLLVATATFAFAAWAFNILVDPYGSNPLRLRFQRPLMDINQRFMYPQVMRAHVFDSAVFGTSTVRLLKPSELEAAFGGHFANFGMNAATPYEQSQAVDLFLRETPDARTRVWGLDSNWCEPDATSPAKRLTERPFPPWLYGGNGWAGLPHLFNLRTLEISARVVLAKLDLMDERLPRDGYEVFTPPESAYDLARARQHIYGAAPKTRAPAVPEPPPEIRASWRFPALAWLDEALAALPAGARLILLFPPVHAADQPPPDSMGDHVERECERRAATIAAAHHGIAVDFRFPSPITSNDANYWDPLHYRLPIASRIVAALKEAESGTRGAADFRVVRP